MEIYELINKYFKDDIKTINSLYCLIEDLIVYFNIENFVRIIDMNKNDNIHFYSYYNKSNGKKSIIQVEEAVWLRNIVKSQEFWYNLKNLTIEREIRNLCTLAINHYGIP